MTTQVLPEPAGPVRLLRTYPAAEGSRLALTCAGPEGVSRMRHLAHDFLERLHIPAPTREDALLIISELVTNAVSHALPPAVLTLHWTPCGILRIDVTDRGPLLPRPTRTDPMEEHGRGLSIVAAVATRHGTVALENGATRWAELVP